MDFALTPAQRELRDRAARFVDAELIPLEEQAELRRRPPCRPMPSRRSSGPPATRGLVGGNHAKRYGGQGWTAFEQVLVQEELGRNTNGVWWNMGGGYNVLARGTDEQIRRYLEPTLRGERADAYAVTEAGAGSDPAGIAATAERTPAGWRIRAEKWFVTSGDVADFDIVMVNVVDGDARLPTLFLVDRDRPGIDVIDDPPFTHSFPHGHPTVRYDCEVGRRRGARRRGHDRARRRAPERVVHRGADPHRRPLRRRDAAAARRRRRVGDRAASSSASASTTSRASASRWPTRRPIAPPPAC